VPDVDVLADYVVEAHQELLARLAGPDAATPPASATDAPARAKSRRAKAPPAVTRKRRVAATRGVG